MIPKSGSWFSEKIMCKNCVARTAEGVLIALMIAGCASGPSSLGDQTASAAPTPDSMTGRWILSAPNAPICGMNFGGTPGAHEGTVIPDGGCPEKFFMSRRWTFAQNKLMINDRENNALAQLNFVSGEFEGHSSTGILVTLARQPTPGN
jgi:protease inhibitor Inh